jgi:hypothetical protein
VVKIAGCANVKTVGIEMENTDLVVKTVSYVPYMEKKYKPHRICQAASATSGLFTCHGNVDKSPEYKTGSKFIESLDIEGSN